MEVTVKAPATCGELIQGYLQGNTFHVTCPINLYNEITIKLSSGKQDIFYPKGYEKAALALRKTLDHLKLKNWGGSLFPQKGIPGGKGMASSTADIAAVAFGVAALCQTPLTAMDIAQIALTIEPTDGLMFPGISLFDHRYGHLYEFLGEAPQIGVLMIDLGGHVDTVKFNQRSDLQMKNIAKEDISRKALEMIRFGLANHDLTRVGAAATLSSLANQELLCKPMLPRIIELSERLNCLGINIAHSGTVAGFLFDLNKVDGNELKAEVTQVLGQKYPVWLNEIVNGGIAILEMRRGEKYWSDSGMGVTSVRLRSNLA